MSNHNLESKSPLKYSTGTGGDSSSDGKALAQKENFAIFALKGMLGHLVHLESITSTTTLKHEIHNAIDRIKDTQAARMQAKRNTNTLIRLSQTNEDNNETNPDAPK